MSKYDKDPPQGPTPNYPLEGTVFRAFSDIDAVIKEALVDQAEANVADDSNDNDPSKVVNLDERRKKRNS